MSAEDYYPPGAYKDPNAPYNEEEEKKEFRVVQVFEHLSKPFVEIEVYENSEGEDYEEAYNSEYYSVTECLGYLIKILENALKNESYEIFDGIKTKYRNKHLFTKKLLRSCQGWKLDFIEIENAIPDVFNRYGLRKDTAIALLEKQGEKNEV